MILHIIMMIPGMGGEHQAVCPHLQGAQRSGLGRQVQHHRGEAALRQRRQDHQRVFHSHINLTHFSRGIKPFLLR